MTTTLLASTTLGNIAVNDGIVFMLTDCCKASAKGSANSPTGVCCRACYAPIPESMGAAWMVDDTAAWDAWDARLTESVYATGANRTPENAAVIANMTATLRESALAA